MTPPLKQWTRFKPELCKSCWASCCHDMPLQVSVPDLVRMGIATEEEASLSLERLARRLRREKVIQTYHRDQMTFVIRQRTNGDCIYLDEKRQCSIYEKRPEICRQFPKIGPKPGFCPYLEK